MYLLPGNLFSYAVEAYKDSGEALCSKGMHTVPPPYIGDGPTAAAAV